MVSTHGRPPIVLGIDAESHTPMAVAWAADEADRRRLPLRLVHAVPGPLSDLRAFDEGRYHHVLRERGEEAVEKATAAARGRRPDLELTGVVLDGSPGQVLCRESAQAALIVLGTRGMNRLEEALSTFSVAAPVSAQAHCPVVVVRAPEHVTQDPPVIVVGVDDSPTSAAAVDVAVDLASRRGADVLAVRAWRSVLIAHLDEPTAVQTLARQLREATAGRTAEHPDVTITHEVVRGHPVEELARLSEHALAVVVGRRGDGGFTGMRLGSVPHGLLRRAPCPVVIVPGSGSGHGGP
ncbi:universal stress protein [Kitasatospora sp. NPDC059571]|uniref:universal stress protein n=1 Tax=Kitasatospora sp. NPDC059571 TaxID=3346871 RepID=UPI0036CA1D71